MDLVTRVLKIGHKHACFGLRGWIRKSSSDADMTESSSVYSHSDVSEFDGLVVQDCHLLAWMLEASLFFASGGTAVFKNHVCFPIVHSIEILHFSLFSTQKPIAWAQIPYAKASEDAKKSIAESTNLLISEQFQTTLTSGCDLKGNWYNPLKNALIRSLNFGYLADGKLMRTASHLPTFTSEFVI
jgi:hypothetical protein